MQAKVDVQLVVRMAADSHAESVIDNYPGVTATPMFGGATLTALQGLVQQAFPTNNVPPSQPPPPEPPRFEDYLYIHAPYQEQLGELHELASELRDEKDVELAYLTAPGPEPAPRPAGALRNPGVTEQGYLRPAPEGIGARHAAQVGANGTNQSLTELERGWTLNHQDLRHHNIPLPLGGNEDASRYHGTFVLGVICGASNRAGGVGIVPRLSHIELVSYGDKVPRSAGKGGMRLPRALAAAVIKASGNPVGPGSVLLIEAQVYVLDYSGHTIPEYGLAPVEYYEAEYDLIRLATALGVTVIEPGGNGYYDAQGNLAGVDLDALTALDMKGQPVQVFNRAIRDSGAIIVSAATSSVPHNRLDFAPYGDRIDLYAWGEDVFAPNSNEEANITDYRADFGGTSAASAIIAGTALAAQSFAWSKLNRRLMPQRLRGVLARGGTPASTGAQNIGVMPDMSAVIRGIRSLR